MATSGECYSSEYNNRGIGFFWNRTSYDSSANTTTIYWELRGTGSSSGYKVSGNFKATLWYQGGSHEIFYQSNRINLYNGTVVGSGYATIPMNNDGSGSLGVSIEAGVYTVAVNVWGNNDWTLDTIPRYPTGLGMSVASRSLNSVTINWWAGQNCSEVQYRINGGGWSASVSGQSGTSGQYTITGLQPNTYYTIEGDFKRADSGMWSSWHGDIPRTNVTTYDIAKINSAPNFDLGSNETISYSNPSGSTIHCAIYKDNAVDNLVAYRNCSGSQYTFNFTDEELDKIYKEMGINTSLTARIYIRTANNYLNYKTATITNTGNQKTIKNNVGGNYKRGKIYINKSGVWKRGIVWKNVQGTWKRGI